ncbi:lyase family protein [Spirosoma telluris]|uniref:lyase family protein n=1 Tax=Spirosoma telluris TaxID=2183553 RepID=UPI002FC29FAA
MADETTVAHMLRFEATLAQVQGQHRIIPVISAAIIADCCQVNLVDLDRLKKEVSLSGNVAIPLVKQLTELVRERDAEAAKYVHMGATSQDVVDTATVLTIKNFLDWLLVRLPALEESLVKLTQRHRQTVMIGRTLLQQAKPIPFGLKTAYWLDGIGRSRQRILEVQKRVLMLQLAGAVGSRNASIPVEVHQDVATQLELHPSNSWHTQRDNLAEFAAVLGILTGSLGKLAKDISLLMQTEVAEVLEGKAAGKGDRVRCHISVIRLRPRPF